MEARGARASLSRGMRDDPCARCDVSSGRVASIAKHRQQGASSAEQKMAINPRTGTLLPEAVLYNASCGAHSFNFGISNFSLIWHLGTERTEGFHKGGTPNVDAAR